MVLWTPSTLNPCLKIFILAIQLSLFNYLLFVHATSFSILLIFCLSIGQFLRPLVLNLSLKFAWGKGRRSYHCVEMIQLIVWKWSNSCGARGNNYWIYKCKKKCISTRCIEWIANQNIAPYTDSYSSRTLIGHSLLFVSCDWPRDKQNNDCGINKSCDDCRLISLLPIPIKHQIL